MTLDSIYTGKLRHRRFFPKSHDFQYEVAFFYFDLARIERIFAVPLFFSSRFPRLMGFHRGDYLKGQPDLGHAVRDLIRERTGREHQGPIRLLTQIRYFGFCFNPVSFYYCFDASGSELEFIVAEITNTPWNERKSYVLECKKGETRHHFRFPKNFHVSPFMPMELVFDWSFVTPRSGHVLSVHMEDHRVGDGSKVFDATLTLKPRPLTGFNIARTVLGFPLLTLKAFLAIYYQAFLLKLKKIPFYPHPEIGEKS